MELSLACTESADDPRVELGAVVREDLVRHPVMSHDRDPLSPRIPEELDVDACSMPGVEFYRGVHVLTMARFGPSVTGR